MIHRDDENKKKWFPLLTPDLKSVDMKSEFGIEDNLMFFIDFK